MVIHNFGTSLLAIRSGVWDDIRVAIPPSFLKETERSL